MRYPISDNWRSKGRREAGGEDVGRKVSSNRGDTSEHGMPAQPLRRQLCFLVYARDEKLPLGLVAVGGVLHHVTHRLQVRIRIFGVRDVRRGVYVRAAD